MSIYLLLSLTILTGCHLFDREKVEQRKDDFYTNSGGLDRPRIPLIKPYELVKVSPTEWRLNLLTPDNLTLSVHHVVGVTVIKQKIMVYSAGGTEVKNRQYDSVWFFIDPVLQKEVAFTDHAKFTDTLKGLNVDVVNLLEPDRLYRDFEKQKNIPWSPVAGVE